MEADFMEQGSARLTKKYNALQTQIHDSLASSEAYRTTLKRKNSRYVFANILLGALAALSAGTAGTIGNADNWKPVCLFAAACSVGVTVTARMQTLEHEKLTETSECVGQLKALKVEAFTPPYNLEELSEKYQQILAEFPAVNC
jgi:hypothetical protein